MKLRVFTDGACSCNPGIGGWAALFLLPEGFHVLSNGNILTTNNRMELIAVVKAIDYFIEHYCYMGYDSIEINSDSAYVVNALTLGWFEKWKGSNWKTKEGKNIKNSDLWIKLNRQLKCLEWLEVKADFVKVVGHSGVEFNEIVDKAARSEVEKIKRGEQDDK